MEDLALVRDLGIVWLAALVAGLACVKLKQPTILGYILAGLVIGPHGLKLIEQEEQVKTLAEIGVALLLFALGVEVTLKEIFRSAKFVVLAGVTQLLVTAALAGAVAFNAHYVSNFAGAVLFGLLCALSSTVVVTKTLMDRGETDSVHGHLIIAILILQDISLVPIISLLPIFTGGEGNGTVLFLTAMAKAIALVLMVILGATKVVPPILKWVARGNSREVFVLTVMVLCLGIAFISKEMGLSLALGAFLAGIMISESPYGHQALSDLFPVKELFATVFFVSVGLLLDPHFILNHAGEVILFVILLIAGKIGVGWMAARIATRSNWSAALVGVGLAQIGEFSFVLASLGYSMKLLTESAYNLFFAGAVVTLVASPMLMALGPKILRHLSIQQSLKGHQDSHPDHEQQTFRNHVIICGYGRIGKQVGNALNALHVPFVVVDVKGEVLENLASEGIPCVYGDAFGRTVLNNAGLNNAAALVVTLPDPVVSLTVIGFARRVRPDLAIVARAHRSDDIEFFRSMGASGVVQPEFESSKEITRLALLGLKADRRQIQIALQAIEQERYKLFRHDLEDKNTNLEFRLAPTEDLLGKWLFKNSDKVQGQSLVSLDIRRKTGATILAIKRGDEIMSHPPAEEKLAEHDELYVAGDDAQLRALSELIGAYPFCPLIEEMVMERENLEAV